MRLLFLGNNRLGLEVLRWLRADGLVSAGAELVGAVLHPEDTGRCGAELRAAAGLPAERIFDGSRLADPGVLRAIADLQPATGLSVLFGYILRPDFLDLFPRGCYNLHPAYLPWNRGANPNVWSLIEGTPAGTTLHRIDAGVDTGPILARRRVPVEPIDTGATLYRKLEDAGLALLRDSWPALVGGAPAPEPQDPAAGSRHRRRDLARIERIDLDRSYTGRELIDLLRARTFAPYPGAWFIAEDGRRVQVRVELSYATEDTP